MDTQTEMIERVARAIAKGEYGENVDDVWKTCIDDARAAIEAMREPTEAMKNAGLSPAYIWVDETAEPVWQRMIDAALAEQS